MRAVQESTRTRLADRAAHLTRGEYSDQIMWWGPTGAEMLGEQVASHLDRAAELLAREGWDPSFLSGFGIIEAIDGPTDLCRVAARCVELILRSVSGAPWADYSLWETDPGRTFDEVVDLLAIAAFFARLHGPRGAR